MRYIIVVALALFLWNCSRTPRTSNRQDAGFTSEIPFTFKNKTLDNDSTIRVYMNVEMKRAPEGYSVSEFLSDYSFSYTVVQEYASKEVLASRNLTLTDQTVRKIAPGTFTLFFDVYKLSIPSAVLWLQITDNKTSQKIRNDVVLRFNTNKFSEEFAVFNEAGDLPYVKHYFYATDTLQIKDLRSTEKQMIVTRYNHDFDPALSPMATAGKNVAKTLEIDTTFMLPTNQPFVLAQPGLYFFQDDTSANAGVGLLIVDKRFPRMTQPEDLVEPLIYISTNNEIKEIASTTAPKRTLDTYWLRLTNNNESKARRTIRAYYRRVTQANELFTTYKEGWKTDMGMVYIVFGRPDQVARSKDKEVWTYTQNSNFSEINFTFVRRPNQFVDNHYELMRYVEYEPIWYPTVEEWRTGIVER
jgi:GWxTD domain-containing protein